MSISKADLDIITKAFNKEVKRAVEAILKANQQQEITQRDYFKDTEKLLYNYPALKDKVEQDEEFLADPDAVIAPKQKSKDIVRFSSTAGCGLDLDRYTDGIKTSMMRTRAEVARIERALRLIRDDKYYRIIELKYFEKKENDECYTYEDIAALFDKDEKTIRRNKNRLINKLKLTLFGIEALTN